MFYGKVSGAISRFTPEESLMARNVGSTLEMPKVKQKNFFLFRMCGAFMKSYRKPEGSLTWAGNATLN